jgi:hypothetical protein
MKLAKLKKMAGNLLVFDINQRIFSADSIEELEQIWQNELMDNGWDIKKPISVRFNWRKFDYEYYFVAKYIS